MLLRSGALRVCVAAADDPGASALSGDRASPIPRKPGERIKTNQQDARKLVELYRAGLHQSHQRDPMRASLAVVPTSYYSWSAGSDHDG